MIRYYICIFYFLLLLILCKICLCLFFIFHLISYVLFFCVSDVILLAIKCIDFLAYMQLSVVCIYSAYWTLAQSTAVSGRSDVYIVYNVVEMKLPCGTPAVDGNPGPVWFPIFIFAFLFVMKLLRTLLLCLGCSFALFYSAGLHAKPYRRPLIHPSVQGSTVFFTCCVMC